MRKVKSKDNKSTERRFRASLISRGISGWKLRPNLEYHPDFYFETKRVVVFIDGCFWHGCPICNKKPSSNKKYWNNKIRGNQVRDKKAVAHYQNEGFNVVRFWEHDISNGLNECINKLCQVLLSGCEANG